MNETPADGPAVLALIDRAFGPGRFAKAAERLRENNRPRLDLSFVAWNADHAIGCVRMWPILIGEVGAVLLGPFAVEDDHRRAGLGGRLIRRACAAADRAGAGPILLVGDEPFYAAYGFAAAAASGVVMPGPVDQGRVLLRMADYAAKETLITGETKARSAARAGSAKSRDVEPKHLD
ncbi:MAG: GNAT family N-acetyltransferase [Caulobacteraceae bacterium]